MKDNEIAAMIAVEGNCSYNEVNKAEFKRLSRKFLKALRDALGISADIRYNAAGIACSGDASLHGDAIYVSFNADGFGLGILFRKCEGRRDYGSKSPNRWYSLRSLSEQGIEGLAIAVKGEMGR